jgi:fumarate reductase subunit D
MYNTTIQNKKEMWHNETVLKVFGISIVVTALAMPVVLLVLSIVASYEQLI